MGLLQTRFEYSCVEVTNHGLESICYFDQVGYFLSPLDFLRECLTFFLFKAAFKRFVFLRLFMPNPLPNSSECRAYEVERSSLLIY